jgi:hypothetical protein
MKEAPIAKIAPAPYGGVHSVRVTGGKRSVDYTPVMCTGWEPCQH